MEIQSVTKENIKIRENILLTEVLLRSLKGNQHNSLLTKSLKSNQVNLFKSASCYSKGLSELIKVNPIVSNIKMENITTIIELLGKLNSNTDYVLQNLIRFLQIVTSASDSTKVDIRKYNALLQYFTEEVNNELEGKETSLIYNPEEHSLEQKKENRYNGA